MTSVKRPQLLSPIGISLHDSSQIEIKTLHSLADSEASGEKISYVQDVYFFAPRSLGINHDSYPKDLFYRSLINYIRIKTPKVLSEKERSECRIDLIMPKLSHAARSGLRPSSVTTTLNEVRLFGAYINDQLKDQLKQFNSQEDASKKLVIEVAQLIKAYRWHMDHLSGLFREGRWLSVLDSFRFVDEFLSNRLEEAVVELQIRGVDVTEVMDAEFARRDEKGYLQVLNLRSQEEDPQAVSHRRETFVYRMGRFKKYISEVLYLEVKRVRKDRLFANIAAAISAGLAAVVAALADPNQRTSMSGGFVSSIRGSLPLMVTVVAIVYVTKDRLKDYFKEHFLTWFRPWIPDYSFQIKSRQGRVIGQCQEEMGFVDRAVVPSEVAVLRGYKRDLPLTIDAHEEVIHYRRSIRVDRHAVEGLLTNSNSLKDILRFDFSPFMAKLSNPIHEDSFIGRDLEIHRVALPKVYHVNLVVRYRTFSHDTALRLPRTGEVTEALESGEVARSYRRVRVILDKNGIKRLEFPNLDELRSRDRQRQSTNNAE